MGATAIFVDIGIISWVAIDKFDLGSESFEDFFIDDTSGAISAIHTNVEGREIDFAEIFDEVVGIDRKGFGV